MRAFPTVLLTVLISLGASEGFDFSRCEALDGGMCVHLSECDRRGLTYETGMCPGSAETICCKGFEKRCVKDDIEDDEGPGYLRDKFNNWFAGDENANNGDNNGNNVDNNNNNDDDNNNNNNNNDNGSMWNSFVGWHKDRAEDLSKAGEAISKKASSLLERAKGFFGMDQ